MKYISVLVLLVWGLLASAQHTQKQPLPLSNKDSLTANKIIAVVPFTDLMYYNDLARLWYKTGECKSQEVQINAISQRLVEVINQELGDGYSILDLNLDQTISTTDFLLELRRLGNFSFADTVPQIEQKLMWKKKKKAKKSEKPFSNGELSSRTEDRTHQFLNVTFHDMKKFRQLCQELEVDEILFINQFDVKGDFNAYSSGRETDYFINIHYSLYSKTGKLLLGNKTKIATTNERARYNYFLSQDLRKAVLEITHNIEALHKPILIDDKL